MKHALILAHPNETSFARTMADAYANAATEVGGEVVLRDLYRLDFDARLRATELPWSADFSTSPDVAREREALRDADVFALVYPFWFNAPPAILKGYVDRVFGFGFGFASVGRVQTPSLPGRLLISVTSSGAPEHWVRETGAFHALYSLFDKHLAEVCGLSVVDHIHFGSVTPGFSAEAVAEAADTVRTRVHRYFSRP